MMKRCKLTPVRLTEIPFNQRMSAARRAAREAADDNERGEIMMAALFPSDKLYWVKTPIEFDLPAAA
jgi:hypothetical protein